MSDALIGLYGIIIGISITVLLRWMDRKEGFRDSTFKNRRHVVWKAVAPYYINRLYSPALVLPSQEKR